jgi:hypothetical protein
MAEFDAEFKRLEDAATSGNYDELPLEMQRAACIAEMARLPEATVKGKDRIRRRNLNRAINDLDARIASKKRSARGLQQAMLDLRVKVAQSGLSPQEFKESYPELAGWLTDREQPK